MSEPVSPSGLLASLRRLLATALEMAQVRLELLGTELELEKQHIFDGLLRAALALVLLGVGLVLLCGFVVLLFWEDHRLTVIAIMGLMFLGAGAFLLRQARGCLHSAQGLFAASVAEIKRDRSDLQAAESHEAK
jgi:uncharacterized membrane protein YqjE